MHCYPVLLCDEDFEMRIKMLKSAKHLIDMKEQTVKRTDGHLNDVLKRSKSNDILCLWAHMITAVGHYRTCNIDSLG